MTYEATKVELFGGDGNGQIVNYLKDVLDTATMAKGALIEISGATDGTRVGTHALTMEAPIAGIASAEVSGTTTHVGVWTQGIFTMRCSGTCLAGQDVMSVSEAGSENWVMPVIAGSAATHKVAIGYALGEGVQQGNIGYLTDIRLNL